MNLVEQIGSDLKEAMKARDELRLGVLRGVKTAWTNLQIEKKNESLPESDLVAIIKKQAKQRQESIASFEKAGRQELADKEKKELAILETYLPEQLSDHELERIIREAAAACGASTKADTGRLMKEVMPRVKGRADGRRVNEIAAKILT